MSILHLSSPFLLAMALIVPACTGSKQVSVQQMHAEATKSDAKQERFNDILLKSALKQHASSNLDYVIGPDDVIEIEVFQAEELKKSVRVSSQGYIGLPLLGQIKAKGLTPSQLEQEIAKRLDKYLEEPLVSVYVKEFKGQKIGVIGAVTTPQIYAVTGQKYLLDMLSMAGGLARDAGSVCYVLRPIDPEQAAIATTETIIIDLKELLERGNLALNIAVFSGDVINVPKGGVFFIDGAIARPGVYPITGRTTLVQAIAMAGGTQFEASKSDIKVYRKKSDGAQEVITSDYTAIQSGQQGDISLEESDIIIVANDTLKSILTGFGRIVGVGINTAGGTVSVGK